MFDELMEEYQTIIEAPPIKDWNESEKAFGSIILDIVEKKHIQPEIRRIPLEKIAIKLNYFIVHSYDHKAEYLGDMQEIAKLREKPGEHPMKIAKEMLCVFCQKGELKTDIDGVFHLTMSGALYKGLENKLTKT